MAIDQIQEIPPITPVSADLTVPIDTTEAKGQAHLAAAAPPHRDTVHLTAMAQAKSLHFAGQTTEQIARSLNLDLKTVDIYLGTVTKTEPLTILPEKAATTTKTAAKTAASPAAGAVAALPKALTSTATATATDKASATHPQPATVTASQKPHGLKTGLMESAV